MDTRQVAKLVGGSAVVYAVVASVPASGPGEGTCNGYASRAVLDSHATVAAASESQGGSRLQPVYLEGEDGARQFLGWFDTARQIDCSFAVATDGAWRCLPAGADSGRFYADAACTQRLATVPKNCKPPTYATVREVPACVWQSSRQVFAMGERYAGPLAYWNDGGACAAVTSADIIVYDLYRLADEVAPSSFVAASRQVEP